MTELLRENKAISDSFEGDFLNRQGFVQQVKTIIELLSANKKNSCFAISGTWGIGKSYILEKLENQLLFEQEEQRALDKYFVFHFNCWEYDYYEEPLIAIVSAMLDDINGREHLFPKTVREHVLSATKFVISKLYEGGSKWFERNTGISTKDITDGLLAIHEDASKKNNEAFQYDKYLNFKNAISVLRDEIKEISSERTVIFIVDELDRCIPEYQIKVLERLHHVFNDIENIQVVLAVDKSQLKRTIQKMFGNDVDTQKYLAKFIKFEIELDEGTYDSCFEESFGYYFDQFESSLDPDIAEFKENIFDGIPCREKIEIVEKCHLLHSLLKTKEEKLPAIFMCIECFLTIVRHIKAELPHQAYTIEFSKMFGEKTTAGLTFLQEKMSIEKKGFNGQENAYYYYAENSKKYIIPSDIWGILLGCYATITETRFDGYTHNSSEVALAIQYSKQFWSLLRTVK